MFRNACEVVDMRQATEREARAVLYISNRNRSKANELFSSYPRQVWTALPKPWPLALGRFPLDVRDKVLRNFARCFPHEVLKELSNGLDREDCEYLSHVALRVFANSNHNAIQCEEFAQALQLGITTLLSLFRSWKRELENMGSAFTQSMSSETARASIKLLLNHTLPSVAASNPAFCGIAEDVINTQLFFKHNNEWQSALHFAANIGDVDLFNNLLARNAKFDEKDLKRGRTALHFGINHPEIVEKLLSAAESAHQLEQFMQQVNHQDKTALHLCSNAESARLLLRVVPKLLFTKDQYGRSTLHSCVNNPDVVELLFAEFQYAHELWNFVRQVDMWGETALYRCRNAESARLLLKVSPDMVFTEETTQSTVLHYSVDYPDVVQVLLNAASEAGELVPFVEQTNEEGQTALHFCKNVESARLLLAASPRIAFIQCNKGDTPLHMQAMYGWEDGCRLLLKEYHVKMNVVNGWGQTPLHFACYYQQAKIVELLLEHSPHFFAGDWRRQTVLHYALMSGYCADVTRYHDFSSFLSSDHLPNTVSILELLLKQDKALVDQLIAARDAYGMTALHYLACIYSDRVHLEAKLCLADKLMLAGANGAARDEEDSTMMHIAVESNNLDLAIHLVKHWGLSTSVKNEDDETVLDLVRSSVDWEALERASVLACAVTLRLAARPRAVQSPWKRLPRELFGELCSFLV